MNRTEYVHKFNTEAELLTYRNSSYIEPCVATVKDGYSGSGLYNVYFNPGSS